MKIRRINDNTINCIISPEDMLENGFNIDDFFERKKEAVNFVRSAVMRAAISENFNLDGELVTARISVLPDHSLSLLITREDTQEGITREIRRIAQSLFESIAAKAVEKEMQREEGPDADPSQSLMRALLAEGRLNRKKKQEEAGAAAKGENIKKDQEETGGAIKGENLNGGLAAAEDKKEKSPAEDKPSENKLLLDKPSEDKLLEDKPSEDKLLEDKPSEDKLLEDKPSEDKLLEDKPSEDKLLEDKPSEDKLLEDKSSEDKDKTESIHKTGSGIAGTNREKGSDVRKLPADDGDIAEKLKRNAFMFSFYTVRDAMDCCRLFSGIEPMRSSLYYLREDDIYYLILRRTKATPPDFDRLVLSANEFGELVTSFEQYIAYVREHGICIAKDNAVPMLLDARPSKEAEK